MCRSPISERGRECSTLELVGEELKILCGVVGDVWLDAADRTYNVRNESTETRDWTSQLGANCFLINISTLKRRNAVRSAPPFRHS
jgi:hypothetical protein